jgi:hypothetical protein
MAHTVFFKVPAKTILHSPIVIRVDRDTTKRKNVPEKERVKGKFGELHISQAGIRWIRSAKHGRKRIRVSKSWRKFAEAIEKSS